MVSTPPRRSSSLAGVETSQQLWRGLPPLRRQRAVTAAWPFGADAQICASAGLCWFAPVPPCFRLATLSARWLIEMPMVVMAETWR